MKAASCGHADIAGLLLDKGVNMETRDTKGVTALQLAVDGEHEAVVRLLLKQGAEIHNTGRINLQRAL